MVYSMVFWKQYIDVCLLGIYIIHKRLFVVDGMQHDVLKTIHRCGFVVHLHHSQTLICSQWYAAWCIENNTLMCVFSIYIIHKRSFEVNGMQHDVLKTTHICGAFTLWHNRSYVVNGMQNDILKTIHGCVFVGHLHYSQTPICS